MMKTLRLLFNPFEQIAGWPAFLWGFGGLVLATFLAYYTQFHYHGLLHYGPAPNNTFVCYIIEHLVVWLISSIVLYIGGLIFSKSKIRAIDLFGTVAFAQLPLILAILVFMLPPVKKLNELVLANISSLKLIEQTEFLTGVLLSLVGLVFVLWMLIWLFNALRVSCNLKSYKLWIVFFVGIFGSDIITRLIIRMFY